MALLRGRPQLEPPRSWCRCPLPTHGGKPPLPPLLRRTSLWRSFVVSKHKGTTVPLETLLKGSYTPFGNPLLWGGKGGRSAPPFPTLTSLPWHSLRSARTTSNLRRSPLLDYKAQLATELNLTNISINLHRQLLLSLRLAITTNSASLRLCLRFAWQTNCRFAP